MADATCIPSQQPHCLFAAILVAAESHHYFIALNFLVRPTAETSIDTLSQKERHLPAAKTLKPALETLDGEQHRELSPDPNENNTDIHLQVVLVIERPTPNFRLPTSNFQLPATTAEPPRNRLRIGSCVYVRVVRITPFRPAWPSRRVVASPRITSHYLVHPYHAPGNDTCPRLTRRNRRQLSRPQLV